MAESTWMHLSELDLGLSSIRMIFVAGFDISEESASSAKTSESESGRLCIYSDYIKISCNLEKVKLVRWKGILVYTNIFVREKRNST